MADVITLGTWREGDTTMAPVLAALDRLRQCDRRGAVRTSFLTLLAVGGASVEVDEVFDTVHRLGPFQPTRVIVVRVLGGDEHRLDARVGVHLQPRGSLCLGIDDVALEVAGPVTSHLDSLVEPLTLPDLPVVVWCRERLPPARSRLIDLADHLVVDTVAAGGVTRLPAVARLHHRTPVIDFAWLRTLPVRRRLARMLGGAEHRRLLEGPTNVAVSGPEVERALLAGWLRAGLPAANLAESDTEGDDLCVDLDNGDEHVHIDGEPPRATEALLAQALLHLQPDRTFTAALGAAAPIAHPTRVSP